MWAYLRCGICKRQQGDEMNNLCWEQHKVTTTCSLLHNAITIQQSEYISTSSKTQNHATTISLTVTRWRVGECLQSTVTLNKNCFHSVQCSKVICILLHVPFLTCCVKYVSTENKQMTATASSTFVLLCKCKNCL